MNEIRNISPEWEFIADTVMSGVSTGSVTATTIGGRSAHRLTGHVSLENDSGFIQMAFDQNGNGAPCDASHWAGIELDVLGNGEVYEVRLRTGQLKKPWQYYRAAILASDDWKAVRVPFDNFNPPTARCAV